MFGEGERQALPQCPGTGPGPAPLFGRRTDLGSADVRLGTDLEVGEAPPGGGGVGVGGGAGNGPGICPGCLAMAACGREGVLRSQGPANRAGKGTPGETGSTTVRETFGRNGAYA